MLIVYSDLFKPKKRRYLKSFNPKLKIRSPNTIRLPRSLAARINRQYSFLKKEHGHSDRRDYCSKLIEIGLNCIKTKAKDARGYDFHAIYDTNSLYFERSKKIKIDLGCISLTEINQIALSLGEIDVYDLISLLVIIGQDHKNGNIKYVDHGHEKIYS